MKVKSRLVCETCRCRKYGCDGKRPACSQCLMTGRNCPGYQDLIFMPPKTTRHLKTTHNHSPETHPSQAGLVPRSSLSTKPLMLNLSTFRWSTDEEFLALVVQYFTPGPNCIAWNLGPGQPHSNVCSPWIEVLPQLLARTRSTPLLSVSLKTLGYSIICRGNTITSRRLWDIHRAESYSNAVRFLQHKLTGPDGASDESAAAIMCLCIAELLIPTSDKAWIAHVRGIGQMMELCGPKSFIKPISHKLFVAFRPLIILEACISRRDTFMSSYEWQTIPFSVHEPSSMQVLLSHGSILPSLLRRAEQLPCLPCEEAGYAARHILSTLIETLEVLDAWERCFRAATAGPLSWPRTAHTVPEKSHEGRVLSLWFPSLLVATSLTHLWAFRAICFSQIAHLSSSYRVSCTESILNGLDFKGCQEQAFSLYTKIRQSVPYFLQDGMMFYGAASVMFPLRVVEAVLGLDPSGT